VDTAFGTKTMLKTKNHAPKSGSAFGTKTMLKTKNHGPQKWVPLLGQRPCSNKEA
jgi:hypothetical protein